MSKNPAHKEADERLREKSEHLGDCVSLLSGLAILIAQHQIATSSSEFFDTRLAQALEMAGNLHHEAYWDFMAELESHNRRKAN